MRKQKAAPSDMQCKDSFLLRSVVANPRTTQRDITEGMFNKAAGRVVDECKLRMIYLPPPLPSSPVAEGSESSRQSMKDNGHQDGSEGKMHSGEPLNIKPLELKFPFELNKQISGLLHLSNKTENNVAFKVKTTNRQQYHVRPNKGIVLPQSSYDVIVTMRAQKEAPSDMQCKDEFFLQSVVANPDTSPEDLTEEMFNQEARCVGECMLRVIYIPPPQPPLAEGSESSRQPMKDNAHQDGSQVVPNWLNCLPVKGDLDEAKYAHDQLCSMVKRLDRELLGPNYQYLPKIISVFAEVLCSNKVLATKKTANRMINVLRHLQETLPPAMWESAWSYLLPRQEMELKSILSPKKDANF